MEQPDSTTTAVRTVTSPLARGFTAATRRFLWELGLVSDVASPKQRLRRALAALFDQTSEWVRPGLSTPGKTPLQAQRTAARTRDDTIAKRLAMCKDVH